MSVISVNEDERRAIALYDRLLASIGQRAAEIEPRPMASHWPHVGTAYRDLVVAGQSLQGWDAAVAGARWQPSKAQSADGRHQIIERTMTWHRDFPEPIAPIVELSHRRRSPFWRLSADLVAALEPDGRGPWYSRYAWANLYPVGPDATATEKAGSPWAR
jgi:hypothetical protein